MTAKGDDGKLLKAPFPYWGGKAAAADLAWARLGDVAHYVEPFAGSLAVLLRRPLGAGAKPGVETVNDLDHFVANFWRATQSDPESVAAHADHPVFEADLVARHRYLASGPGSAEFRRRVEDDPDYCDARLAGWWCWGLCNWVGSGWCREGKRRPERSPRGTPLLRRTGTGVNSSQRTARKRLPPPGEGPGGGTCSERRAWMVGWFSRLRDRLRNVRVCCGDWSRVCSSESVLTGAGVAGVFFDPPYGKESGRDMGLYARDSGTVAADVREWCLRWGGNPSVRIVLAGMVGEGHEVLESEGWAVAEWRSRGGWGLGDTARGRANAARERLWCSPHCATVSQRELFD